MWKSKGLVRTIGLIMLMVGTVMSGGMPDFSTLPEILQGLGLGAGSLGIINWIMSKMK